MTTEAILGVDVAKGKFDAALMFGGGKMLVRSFENSAKGYRLLDGWLRSLRVGRVHACLEASGPYGEGLAEFLDAKGHAVSVVNPLRIKAYAASDLKRNKSDRADARTIAEFCLAKDPPAWHPLPPEVKRLRDLSRRIETLEGILAAEHNRLDAAPREVRPSLKRVIRALESEIKGLEQEVRRHIDEHPDLKGKSDLLCSIPGIGEKTARLLIGEIEFAAYRSARSLAAQAGLSPHRRQSGTSLERTRLSKLGNGRIRKALYFPAITAVRHNRVIKGLAERLSRRGKTPMQIVCAAMRKLLHIAFGVIKHNRPFDPDLISSI